MQLRERAGWFSSVLNMVTLSNLTCDGDMEPIRLSIKAKFLLTTYSNDSIETSI